jgi:hypothetical protein
MELTDAPDERLLTLSGKPYTSRSAYAALDQVAGTPDAHGRHIWTTRVPNKVKIFAWLYFKDRLSARTNLFAKHILDYESCQRCSNATEDCLHVFFGCPTSAELWEKIGLSSIALLSDTEVWSANMQTCGRLSCSQFCGEFGMPGTEKPSGMSLPLVVVFFLKSVMIL